MSTGHPDGVLRRIPSPALTAADVADLRALLWSAFADDPDGAFSEDDWSHALGGIHVTLDVEGAIVSHAAVVERPIHVAGRALRTGYVEAVATAPDRQGQGFGTRVMTEVGAIIADGFELGVLGTGRHGFYERLGWRTWRGPSGIRTDGDGVEWTPDDDGYLMVLETPTTPTLDPRAPITCDRRPGDSW